MTKLNLFKRLARLEEKVDLLDRWLDHERDRRYADLEVLHALMEHLGVVFEKQPPKGRVVPSGKRKEEGK